MTAINSSSGSLYPGKTLIDSQLASSQEDPVSLVESSGTAGASIPLSTRVYSDLTRLNTLVVNKETIYAKSQIPGSYDDDDDNVQKTNYVFNKMELKLNSTTLAIRASHLLEQNLGGEVLRQVIKQKGLSTATSDDGAIHSSHAVTKRETASILTTTESSFKLIHEEMVEKTPMENIDSKTFFKIKTVVKGPLAALESAASQDMSIETAYTKEHSSKEAAFKDDYTGTRVGGLFNRESYLKA